MADDMKMRVNVEPYIDLRKLQSQIDRETKNLTLHAELVITQSKQSQQKILKEIKNYYTQLEQYQAQYASSNSNFYNLELKKNNQYLNNYASLLQKQVELRSSLGGNSQLAYMKQSDTPAKSSSSSSATEQISNANPAAALLNSLQTTGSIVSQFNALLTELSIASSVATANLNQLGTAAFQTTSQCGLAAREYLQIIQDIGNANGFAEQTEQISALSSASSLLIDFTKEYANAVLGKIATDEAASGISALTTTTLGSATAAGAATTATGLLAKSFQTLKTAFVTNPFGLILVAITTAITALSSVIAKQQQEQAEYIQKAKEQAKESSSLTTEVSNLTNKYYALTHSIKEDESARQSLLSTQSQLLEQLGLEGKTIDELTEKYGSLKNAITSESLNQLKTAESDLLVNLGIREEELKTQKDVNLHLSNFGSAALPELGKSGLFDKSELTLGLLGGGNISLKNDNSIEDTIKNYEKLIAAQQFLLNSSKLSNEELKNDDVFIKINKQITKYAPSIEAYKQAVIDLNKNIATQEIISIFQSDTNSIPKTEEEILSFKRAIQDTLIANNDFAGSEEELKTAIDNTLASFIEFSSFTDVTGNNMTTLAEQMEEYYKKQNEETDKFQASISSIRTSIENVANLSTSDIINLMQQYNDFNWSDWGVIGVQGVGDLEGALKALATQQYNTLDSTLKHNEGLKSLYEEAMSASQSILSVSEAIENLNNTNQLINDVNKEFKELGYISTETLNNLVKKYPELDSIVAEYNLGLASSQDIFTELAKCYNIDFENYKTTVIAKMEKSETFYKEVLDTLPDWVKDLSKSYKLELENYDTYLQGKLALDRKYYEVLLNVKNKEVAYEEAKNKSTEVLDNLPYLMKGSASELNDKILDKFSTDIEQERKELAGLKSILDELNKAFDSTAGLVDEPTFKEYPETSSSGSSQSSSSSHSSDSSTKEKQTVFSDQINYADDRIKVLQKDLDKLNVQLTNTSSLEKQSAIYEQLINKQTELGKAYLTTTSKGGIYYDAYQNALNNKNLTPKDKERIENGELTIQNYEGTGENSKGELGHKSAIAAMEARDNLNEMKLNYQENFDTIRQYAQNMASLPWEIASKKVEVLNSDIDLLNEKLNNTDNYDTKISLLNNILKKQEQIVSNQHDAVNSSEENMEAAYAKINKKYLTTASGKKIEAGTKIQTGQAKNNPEELANIITYNMSVDEYKAANRDFALANEKFNGIKSDNYTQQFDALSEKIDKTLEKHSNLLSLTDNTLSFFDEGSVEQVLLLQTAFEQATNKSEALKKEIKNLTNDFSKGKLNISIEAYETLLTDLNYQLIDSGKTAKQYQSDIISAMKTRYDKEIELSSKTLKSTLDDIEKKKKAEFESIDDQLDKYKESIEARKKFLNKDKADQDYQNELDTYTASITKLETRIALLSQAEATGDRAAGKERRELEVQLAEEKKKLTEYQTEYGLNQVLEALDDEYSEFERLKKLERETTEATFEQDITAARKIHEDKEAQVNALYEKEKNLIIEAAKLTDTEFSKAFASINTTLSTYGVSFSTEQAGAIRDFITDNRANTGSTTTDATIKTLLQSGTSQKGDSALNKYIYSKYGSNLSYSQMLELAKLLDINDITQIDDVKIAKNRQKILTTLKNAKFSSGGTVDASKSNSPIAAMFGEDGIALVKHNEEILTPEKATMLKSLLDVAKPLTIISKLATGNISNSMTNRYSSPTIQFNLNGGTITPDAIQQFNNWKNDIVKEVSKAIVGDVRKR